MDIDRVRGSTRVASGQYRGDRYFLSKGRLENHPIPLLETIRAQGQTSQLIFPKRIGACQIKKQIRREAHGNSERPSQPIEIFMVANSIAQVDVDGGRRLLAGIVVELMQRQCENASVAGKDGRGAVAVVHITIHDERSIDQRFVLESANRDRNIVDRAESLAVSSKSVMKSAADIEPDAIA